MAQWLVNYFHKVHALACVCGAALCLTERVSCLRIPSQTGGAHRSSLATTSSARFCAWSGMVLAACVSFAAEHWW